MARLPVELIPIGSVSKAELLRAAERSNTVQSEILFSLAPDAIITELGSYLFAELLTSSFLEQMDQVRKAARGFHPYLIAFVDASLKDSEHANLFGNIRRRRGLAVVTIAKVPDIIIPRDRLLAYYVYYLARYTLGFLAPDHENHDDPRGCVFDFKSDKTAILKSMKTRALCDICRRELLLKDYSMSPGQLQALERLFELAGTVLNEEKPPKPRVFIGSSLEGLEIANKLQELLSHTLSCVVWNQGTVFVLGSATLEALEKAVGDYDFAIFVFTPDDKLYSRGEPKPAARDNVVFESGLFIGKLTRWKAFVVQPSGGRILLPSDFKGITTAQYDHAERDLAAALGPVCNKIRDAVRQAELKAET